LGIVNTKARDLGYVAKDGIGSDGLDGGVFVLLRKRGFLCPVAFVLYSEFLVSATGEQMNILTT
jgi:hypothetical protein